MEDFASLLRSYCCRCGWGAFFFGRRPEEESQCYRCKDGGHKRHEEKIFEISDAIVREDRLD